MTTELSSTERKNLRGRAMNLKPSVIVGKSGPTASVLAEIDSALTRNELIKIRILADDRPQRQQWLDQICTATNSAITGQLGHTASIYRKKAEE